MSFDETYFSSHTYKDVSFARFSQYWWSNRFYAALARRYGQKGARLLEIGSGLGHLVGQLEETFQTFALDVNRWALRQSFQVAGQTSKVEASAEVLPFADATFGVVIIKHVVEHLPHPERAIAEIGRVIVSGGILILSTPNLSSLLKPWKGERWIGYLDPTHISLKPPEDWLGLIRGAGFRLRRVFSDGFWDAPYLPVIPKQIQKLFFGSLGGVQAILTWPFLPLRWGESMIVIAQKEG
ncbi:MAG: class I SAM-dependent methyltransferase [Anaerolineales bacterium]|nr:class I SAM-dependent methyltransferase [Anaerolineales bacterium]MCX7609305.1 class I SAM-dependent methyltransferase [Anaerolineales bacterium]MDW8226971.1 class I SAM-dependent methyltransferase [Anaerolineales bacterium]